MPPASGCPLPAPQKARLEVIISLKVGREWKIPQSIVGGRGSLPIGPEACPHWAGGRGVQLLSRAWEGHLLPRLSASSCVRTLDKSHGFSGSRRPGPRLPSHRLLGPWALGCIWARGTGDPGCCDRPIGIYLDLESEAFRIQCLGRFRSESRG